MHALRDHTNRTQDSMAPCKRTIDHNSNDRMMLSKVWSLRWYWHALTRCDAPNRSICHTKFLPSRPTIHHYRSNVTSNVAWSQHHAVNPWARDSTPTSNRTTSCLLHTSWRILLLPPVHWSFLFCLGSHLLTTCSPRMLLHTTNRLPCLKHAGSTCTNSSIFRECVTRSKTKMLWDAELHLHAASPHR